MDLQLRKGLIPPHPLANFEKQNYYENEPIFNGVYSRDNFSMKIKSGAYMIYLDEYAVVGTHWIALYVSNNEITYLDSFDFEPVPQKIMHFIGQKNLKAKIFRMQADNSITCGYFCTKIIEFMLAGESLIQQQ